MLRCGQWVLLQKSIGISAMHMQVMYNNKVVMFDRTDFGPSNLTLPGGKCRHNDEILKVDCTAHSVLYDISTNTYRPLMVQTDVWCSSGAVDPDGTLVQTGGYHAGDDKIRLFTPCNDDKCDWVELPQILTVERWYASNQILPDGRVIIVGGRRSYNYEFFPKSPIRNSPSNNVVYFPFLKETTDPNEENNLYPFLHLLPDGNLFVFANQRSIILDYVNNKIIKEFPVIPGEKRTYPSTGSSLMLPLKLSGGGRGGAPSSPDVEVLVCGGAKGGSYTKASKKGVFASASNTCGRLRVTDPNPNWVMEEMPQHRVMPDMLLLPTGNVIILNGAAKGTAGWECADHPIVNPLLYFPNKSHPKKRFIMLNPTTIARMYHSAATLLPDGRILVGGSNPHVNYSFTGVRYPTDLSLEAFSPPYKAPHYDNLRPTIISVDAGSTNNIISYGQIFSVTFKIGLFQPSDIFHKEYMVAMVTPTFNTHSFAMNQRLLKLNIVDIQKIHQPLFAHKVTVNAPATKNIAPQGYYMLFVVHQGIPGPAAWIKMK
ncbi:glyoxal oxidase-related protein [Forsythia ovata]|uniref:Glyoxal oxidase-related protein n=1 Tax=Forsythia ovata TaxID=205694 RepID=A0ABD1XBZ9_9LAMI